MNYKRKFEWKEKSIDAAMDIRTCFTKTQSVENCTHCRASAIDNWSEFAGSLADFQGRRTHSTMRIALQ